MSATNFRTRARQGIRAPHADEFPTDGHDSDQLRRIARLEGELAEARREIERLQASLSVPSPAADGERAALREIWHQTPQSPPSQSFSLLRWLRSLV